MHDQMQVRKVQDWARQWVQAAQTAKLGPITDKAQAWVQARAAIKEAAATAAEAGRAAGAVAEVINERSTIYPRKYGGIPCQD
jgi:hypothetical protein